ncbi:hypothetical protein OE88DRAFT_1663409 [Heliocybe sulcata]|uniref:Uncharacterized protein n=1 Tax=Heliocybe sulcata TaxID=5364 RepID=A0A5C3MW11_9AGAM|nr:hypothetical protein OE88DRAFT_1663409 [Heliocybe sulcata]
MAAAPSSYGVSKPRSLIYPHPSSVMACQIISNPKTCQLSPSPVERRSVSTSGLAPAIAAETPEQRPECPWTETPITSSSPSSHPPIAPSPAPSIPRKPKYRPRAPIRKPTTGGKPIKK